MLKQLMLLDGVMAICLFRDDGQLVEGYGFGNEVLLSNLCKFAHDYKRLVQGNADQLAMFTQMSGWTPPGGWVVRGKLWSVCSIANLVCVVDMRESSLNPVMAALKEAASW